MAKCVNCMHHDVCVKLGKPSLYGINKELGCDKCLEVVRCKDCKHWKLIGVLDPHWECQIFCGLHDYGYLTGADDFCSYGERREGE